MSGIHQSQRRGRSRRSVRVADRGFWTLAWPLMIERPISQSAGTVSDDPDVVSIRNRWRTSRSGVLGLGQSIQLPMSQCGRLHSAAVSEGNRSRSASRLKLSNCRRAMTRSPTDKAKATQRFVRMTILSSKRVVLSAWGTRT